MFGKGRNSKAPQVNISALLYLFDQNFPLNTLFPNTSHTCSLLRVRHEG
jgi:hypothetical protein